MVKICYILQHCHRVICLHSEIWLATFSKSGF